MSRLWLRKRLRSLQKITDKSKKESFIMRKIILLCAAGMSTSALVRKMQDAARAENYECEISAHSVSEAKNYGSADIILLGPQVRYRLAEVQKLLPGNKVEVIDMKDYGMMNGKNVLAHVRSVLGD